jgi:hypothetical protein
MDTPVIIALLVAVVVVFFAYQWYMSSSRRAVGAAKNAKVAAMTGAAPAAEVPAPLNPVVKEEKMPVVAGQTEQELKAKEPVQSRQPVVTQEAVTYEGEAPAQFATNLRHPEQSFHQPAPQKVLSDASAGRAAVQSTPLSGNQQGFSPEMAQNGGALIGNSMFAYDGMEPTEFTAF